MTLSISTVSGDYVQGSFGLLPHAGERARAALYFSRHVSSQRPDENIELARWYLRAALSEFRSLFDLLEADFKEQGLAALWKQSQQRRCIESDPLVTILRKVRDFAIHSSIVKGEPTTFKVVSLTDHDSLEQDIPAIVFETLDRGTLTGQRGKDELSNFSDEALSIFNEHARRWPSDLLVQIVIYRTSEYLASFLADHTRRDQ